MGRLNRFLHTSRPDNGFSIKDNVITFYFYHSHTQDNNLPTSETVVIKLYDKINIKKIKENILIETFDSGTGKERGVENRGRVLTLNNQEYKIKHKHHIWSK
jgi:hypothetical protein